MASSFASKSTSSFSSWRRRWADRIRGTTNPDLTEASLKEHNRRIEPKNSCSPYYKGLTDYTLSIDWNRIRNARRSPGRDSQVTTATARSFSSFVIKARNFGSSCVSCRTRENPNPNPAAFEERRPPPPPSPPPPQTIRRSISPSLKGVDSRVSVPLIEVRSDRVGSRVSREMIGSTNGKPMRERIATVSKKSGVEGNLRSESGPLMEKEKEFVWANKYRPKALKDFICNSAKAELLQDTIAGGEYGHFIFEGLPGVGKRTMVMAFLREAFGPENLETKDELKEFELEGQAEARIEVNVKLSPRHIELNLSDLYGYEKHVIMSLLVKCDHSNCRAIVLHKADKLSADAQQYIRWIGERDKSCSKIFFCCSDVSKLQPIKSICTLIQLLPPSNHEIIEVLEYIAEQEGIDLPRVLAERISKNSKQNLRQAIRSFEATWQLNYSLKEDQVILTGWEDVLPNIAKNIVKEQSPKQLYIIRGKLQNLIEHNVSPDFIFSILVEELKKHLDDQFKPKIDAFYLEYNDSRFPMEDDTSLALRRQQLSPKWHHDRLRENVHHFMRIEEFIAKFMSFYKTFGKNFGGSNNYEI